MTRNVKGAGSFLGAVSSVVMAAATIAYLVFAFSSGTFNVKVLLAFAAALVCGGVLFRKENKWSDYIVIAATAMAAIGLGLFVLDSVGDFTDFFSGIVMYGNPKNVPVRCGLIGAMLAGILLGIVSSFLPRSSK